MMPNSRLRVLARCDNRCRSGKVNGRPDPSHIRHLKG